MWVVVEAKSKDEFLAEREIKALGIQTYLPQYVHRIRHARTTKLVRRALFPGYLFAEIGNAPNWPRILSRRGVTGMIMTGACPKAVPESKMAEVRKLAGEYDGVILEAVPLAKGQIVQIITGTFSGFKATVSSEPKGATVRLETTVFGKLTPIILPRDHVAAVQAQ